MRSTLMSLFWILLIFNFLGCESKVVEKKTGSYDVPVTAETKVKIQNDFENRIARLQVFLNNVQNVIQNVKKAIGQDTQNQVAMFELMNLVNTGINDVIPSVTAGKIDYVGDFEVIDRMLVGECRLFSFLVSADSSKEMEQINYKIKSCKTNGLFLSFFTLKFQKKNFALVFDKENLEKIYPVDLTQLKNPNCEFRSGAKSLSQCTEIPLGKTEKSNWMMDIAFGEKIIVNVIRINKVSKAISFQGKITFSKNGNLEGSQFSGELLNE